MQIHIQKKYISVWPLRDYTRIHIHEVSIGRGENARSWSRGVRVFLEIDMVPEKENMVRFFTCMYKHFFNKREGGIEMHFLVAVML
jgi:hypothetical protein